MIRNAEPGTIVWMAYGHGPKAVVIEKRNMLTKKTPWRARGIYYTVKILEDQGVWSKGTITDKRAMTLSRKKHIKPSSEE